MFYKHDNPVFQTAKEIPQCPPKILCDAKCCKGDILDQKIFGHLKYNFRAYVSHLKAVRPPPPPPQ